MAHRCSSGICRARSQTFLMAAISSSSAFLRLLVAGLFFLTLPPTAPSLYSTTTVTAVSALVNTTTTEGENRWSQKGYLPLPLPRLSSFLSDFTTNSAVTYSTATFTTVSALVNTTTTTTTTTEGENRWSQKGYLLLLVRLTTSRQVLLSKRKDPRRANGGRRRRRKWLPSRKSANGHDKYQKSNGVP